jgi:hypothetical protein
MTHDTTTHVHDPDPPSKQGTGCIFGKEKWQPEEWIRVKNLIDRKHNLDYIALVSGRSKEQIKGKIRWETMTEEKKQERRDRLNAYRNKERGSNKRVKPPIMTHRAPPPELLAEREMRLMAPQTLTGALCGDPPPGFSALDRKQRGEAEPVYIDHSLAQLQRKPSLAGAST